MTAPGAGLARRTALLGLAGGLLGACMPDGTGARPSRLPDEGPLRPVGDAAPPPGADGAGEGIDGDGEGVDGAAAAVTRRGRRRSVRRTRPGPHR